LLKYETANRLISVRRFSFMTVKTQAVQAFENTFHCTQIIPIYFFIATLFPHKATTGNATNAKNR